MLEICRFKNALSTMRHLIRYECHFHRLQLYSSAFYPFSMCYIRTYLQRGHQTHELFSASLDENGLRARNSPTNNGRCRGFRRRGPAQLGHQFPPSKSCFARSTGRPFQIKFWLPLEIHRDLDETNVQCVCPKKRKKRLVFCKKKNKCHKFGEIFE